MACLSKSIGKGGNRHILVNLKYTNCGRDICFILLANEKIKGNNNSDNKNNKMNNRNNNNNDDKNDNNNYENDNDNNDNNNNNNMKINAI